jgi:hypothetical protein
MDKEDVEATPRGPDKEDTEAALCEDADSNDWDPNSAAKDWTTGAHDRGGEANDVAACVCC